MQIRNKVAAVVWAVLHQRFYNVQVGLDYLEEHTKFVTRQVYMVLHMDVLRQVVAFSLGQHVGHVIYSIYTYTFV